MTTATTNISSSHHPSLQRVPLAPISDFSLNISKNTNSTPYAIKSKSFNLPSISTSTPHSHFKSSSQFSIYDQSNTNNNNTQLLTNSIQKRTLSSLESQVQRTPSNKRSKISFSSNGDLNDDSDIFTSPTLEKARMLKVKLQLAYYKVKTNQTKVLLKDLQHMNNDNEINNELNASAEEEDDNDDNSNSILNDNSTVFQQAPSRNAIADLLAASTPIIGKQRTLLMTKSFSDSSSSTSYASITRVPPISITRKRPTLKRANSSMDEVVKKRGVSANLKRASVEFMKSIPDLQHPASTQDNKSKLSTTTTVSSSSSASSDSLPQSARTIPLPRNKHVSAFTISTHTTTSPSKFAITSPTDDHHNQSNSLMNNNNIKSKFRLPPVPSFALDIPPIKRTLRVPQETSLNNISTSSSSSSTTLAENSQSLLITPVRKASSNRSSKKSETIIEGSNETTIINDSDTTNTNDNDATQLMSSPTRLMSTPSSIGAARCLLQLAHR